MAIIGGSHPISRHTHMWPNRFGNDYDDDDDGADDDDDDLR